MLQAYTNDRLPLRYRAYSLLDRVLYVLATTWSYPVVDYPIRMVPKHKSALLFGFTKSILVVFLFQWIGIRQEDGIKVSGCHGSRNLTALNQKYPQLLSLFPTKVERTVMIRNNILFVRAVLNMFCQ